jgi:hypothetical protein
MDAHSYARLHKLLGQALQVELQAAPPDLRAVLLRLEAFIEPWLSLAALLALDRRTLTGLVQSCQSLHREIGADKKKKTYPIATVVLACLIALATLFAWLRLCLLVVLGAGTPCSAESPVLRGPCNRGRFVAMFAPSLPRPIHREKVTA